MQKAKVAATMPAYRVFRRWRATDLQVSLTLKELESLINFAVEEAAATIAHEDVTEVEFELSLSYNENSGNMPGTAQILIEKVEDQ